MRTDDPRDPPFDIDRQGVALSHPEQEPLPGLGEPPRRPRASRPVATGLAVAAISALAGAAIAHEAWSGSGSPSSNSLSQLPSNGQFGQLNPSSGSGRTATASVSSVAARVDPGLVDINTQLATQGAAAGTGMVVTSSGEVITNNHVISEATSITATDVGSGRTYTARVVGYDASKDIAVLRLEGASGLATVSFANSSGVHTGQSVITIGNAGGVGGTPAAAAGSVTATGQSITAGDEVDNTTETLTGLIELNGQLQPGDSGGPLVDSAGEVIGMDTAASSNFSFQSSGGQGFAIPANTVLSISRQIVAGKGSSTIHIGPTALIGVDITPALPVQCGFTSTGSRAAYVYTVLPGGPAAAAGIASCDSITSLAGHGVRSPSGLVAIKDRFHPGDRVRIAWVDQGSTHTATLRLGVGPAD